MTLLDVSKLDAVGAPLYLSLIHICSRAAGTRTLFENYLMSHSESIRSLNVIMEMDSVATIKELVALGMGITVIAHSACREEELAGRLAVIPIENARRMR